MQTIRYTGLTHPGLKRTGNEDAFLCQPLWTKDRALLLVIDGVGGYAGGNRAANIARESIRHYMQTPKGDTLTMLREAIIFANNRIREEREKVPRYAEMCCVLTAVITDSEQAVLHYVHVGDTRLYLFRDGKLSKITRDHSFVGIREDAGELTEVEAMQHPQRNMILREVGSAAHRIDDADFMDYGTEDFQAGDSILLCTDGLSDMIDVNSIVGVLSGKGSLNQKAEKLISLANEAGGHDNITVIIAGIQKVKIAPNKEIQANPVDSETVKDVKSPTAAGDSSTRFAKAKGVGMTGIMIGAITFMLLLGIGWFFIFWKSAATTTGKLPDAIDTLSRKQPAAPPAPMAILPSADTMLLRSPLDATVFKKSRDSSGARITLLPLAGAEGLVAMDLFIPQKDSAIIKNIEISGFQTGIIVRGTGTLILQDVLFQNVGNPLSIVSKKDSAKAKIIIQTPINQ
ncbi:MAG: serine/threonine-protein phosphatase [Gemmatimonadaceae bacterium]|nr:serine/threonine-protein phosphatase [Chitinophagaceae bacterium]